MPVRRWTSAAVAVAAALVAAAGAHATASAGPAMAITAVTPASPHAGAPVTIDITGAPDDGVRTCLLPGYGQARCQRSEAAGDGRHQVLVTAPYAGRWTIVVDAGSERATERLHVLPHGDRLSVLAVGDSLVESLARGLAGRLHLRRDVTFSKDVELGRGLSKGDGYDWTAAASDNVARDRPDVVVVFLGGNEGYTLDGYECCGSGWIERFARLQRRLMQVYAGDGTTRVYWCTLPAPGPRRDGHRVVWAAENLALRTAAADDDARVFDVDALLTPGFQWREGMRWRGRWRFVRQADQVHLNRVGGRIAAYALLKQLKRDRVDVPLPNLRPGVGHDAP